MLLGGLLLSLLVMVMVLTVSTFRLIVRCLVAYTGGLDVSSLDLIDVSVFSASGSVFYALLMI